MKINDTTVIICCAGMGTRLGIGTTKCLIDICGKPLIIRLLELLKDYNDIRIVVGYQSNKVIELVTKYRKDIMFAFNYDYENTGPAASMSKALVNSKDNLLILDGDLVIDPIHFKKIINYSGECLPYCEKKSDEPILINIKNNKITKLNVNNSNYEWTGIVKIKRKNITEGKGYVYEILNSKLPMNAIHINARGIDTQNDYERVIYWINNNYKDNIKLEGEM